MHPAHAFQAFIDFFGEVDVQLAGKTFPRQVMVMGSVNDNTIKVENTGFDHGFSFKNSVKNKFP